MVPVQIYIKHAKMYVRLYSIMFAAPCQQEEGKCLILHHQNA